MIFITAENWQDNPRAA